MVTGSQPFDEEMSKNTQKLFPKWVTLNPKKV